MSRFLIMILVLIISACGQKPKNKDSTQIDFSSIKQETANKISTISEQGKNLIFTNGPSREKLYLNEPTVIIVQFDSLEIEQVKKYDGEDNFYTASDDLMWYNSMMLEKMDSLKIPVKYTNKDTVNLYSTDFKQTIVKDTTFSLYTYFYFNGKEIKRKEIFELISN